MINLIKKTPKLNTWGQCIENIVPKALLSDFRQTSRQNFHKLESNVKSEFRATSIDSLNREELLKKAPACAELNDKAENDESTFEKFLHQPHFISSENSAQSNNSNPLQKNKRHVATTAKSVGANDCDMFMDEEENIDDPVPLSSSAGPTPKNIAEIRKLLHHLERWFN